jgi:hypothetical protein
MPANTALSLVIAFRLVLMTVMYLIQSGSETSIHEVNLTEPEAG